VVRQATIALGIEAAFWNEQDDGPRAVRPLVRPGVKKCSIPGYGILALALESYTAPYPLFGTLR
jgi:hypothetical protein